MNQLSKDFKDIMEFVVCHLNLEVKSAGVYVYQVKHETGAPFSMRLENNRIKVSTVNMRSKTGNVFSLNVKSITVSMERDIISITGDIAKRFIEKLVPEYLKIKAEIDKSNSNFDNISEIADKIAALTGGTRYKNNDYDPNPYISSRIPDATFEVRSTEWVRMEGNFSPDQIVKMLNAIKE